MAADFDEQVFVSFDEELQDDSVADLDRDGMKPFQHSLQTVGAQCGMGGVALEQLESSSRNAAYFSIIISTDGQN